MKKTKQCLTLISLFFLISLLSACGKKTTIPQNDGTDSDLPQSVDNRTQSSDDAEEQDDSVTSEITGYFSMGIDSIPQEDGKRIYSYNGGEVSFEASMEGKGLSYNETGFLLYMDGVPVPYSIDDVDNGETAYFHIIHDMNGKGEFSCNFHFVPYGGTAGEEGFISLLAIAQPEYVFDPGIPDNVPDDMYGAALQPTVSGFELRFQVSAPQTEDMPEFETLPLISNALITEETNQNDFVEELNATYYANTSPKLTLADCFGKNIQCVDYYDGVYDASGKVCIDGKDTVHIRYRFLGKPDSRLDFAFCLGKECVPVLIDGRASCSLIFEEGKYYTFEADLDVSGFTETTKLRCNIFEKFEDDFNMMSRNAILYFTAAE